MEIHIDILNPHFLWILKYVLFMHNLQTAGLMRLIDRECEGLNTRGYDQAQKIWSGMDMLAQLNSIGLANNKYEGLMVGL